MESLNFREQVYAAVSQIPKGKVGTYGQIAAMIGRPRAARQVGFSLRALGLEEPKVPWWRVINKQGYLSINHGDQGGMEKVIQKEILESEGVLVSNEYLVEMDKYLWSPSLI